MLEIVFDETNNDKFLGEHGKLVHIDSVQLKSWKDYRRVAFDILRENANERVVIIEKMDEMEICNNLALALSVEDYFEIGKIETLVFKVMHSGVAMLSYKPFMALANSLRYARDLYRLEDAEWEADIKRLGYLGLSAKEDYINKKIVLEWPGAGEALELVANDKMSAIGLVAILKTIAICKEKFKARGVIYKSKSPPSQGKIIGASCEDEMIEQIINYVRKKIWN